MVSCTPREEEKEGGEEGEVGKEHKTAKGKQKGKSVKTKEGGCGEGGGKGAPVRWESGIEEGHALLAECVRCRDRFCFFFVCSTRAAVRASQVRTHTHTLTDRQTRVLASQTHSPPLHALRHAGACSAVRSSFATMPPRAHSWTRTRPLRISRDAALLLPCSFPTSALPHKGSLAACFLPVPPLRGHRAHAHFSALPSLPLSPPLPQSSFSFSCLACPRSAWTKSRS